MEIPKDQILDMIRQQKGNDQAAQADQEMPEQVDPERDSGLLAKFGIDPGDVLSKFGGGSFGL